MNVGTSETDADALEDANSAKDPAQSSNEMILVGRSGVDAIAEWQMLYRAAMAEFSQMLAEPCPPESFRQTARALTAIFKSLRELRFTFVRNWLYAPAAAIAFSELVSCNRHSFFHAGKVDGRNAP